MVLPVRPHLGISRQISIHVLTQLSIFGTETHLGREGGREVGRDTLNIVISTFLPSLSLSQSQIVLEYFGYTLLMHDSNLKEGISDLNIYSRL